MATAGAGFELTGDATGDFTIEPCDAAVVVAHGQCEVLDGPHGSVTVFIDVESGATVNVYDGELELAAQFVGTGGSSQLAPGTYTWQAIPGEGFEFPEGQSTSGEFTIDPCVSTVIVTHGNCIEGASTAFGSVTVEIDPAAAATVSILNSGAQVVATFTGPGGSQSLVAGAYNWVTAAVEGYTVAGDGSGSFTVAACPDEVEGEEIVPDEVEELVVLPFTGLSTEALLGAATVLLGTGWVLIRTARRREEG